MIDLHLGNCLEIMRAMPDCSVDSIVTDPPYELTASKRTVPAPHIEGSPYSRHRVGVNGDTKPVGGFMGKEWDGTGIAFKTELWAEALRVLKPGAYLLAFSGSRTYHRMVCAIEDAGFEIRDQIMWLYGSGFPKSHNGDWGGTALKPAHEPIVVARKPLVGTVAKNWAAYGTGALNIDACRVEILGPHGTQGRKALSGHKDTGTVHLTGGLNSEVSPPHDAGRWPANVIHDGSEEVLAAFPDAPGQMATASTSDTQRAGQNVYGIMSRGSNGAEPRSDMGSAARFFYAAKASQEDRNEGAQNTHPTVKPTVLMRYLCRLVTPPGGVVLDPFMGSGSTGKASVLEGFNFVGIDMTPEYVEIARARIDFAMRQGHQPGLI